MHILIHRIFQLIAEIGSQAMDIARTQGEITATREAKENVKNLTPELRGQAQKEWEKANPGMTATAADVVNQAWKSTYDRALEKVINPNWKNWAWVDVGMGISKPMPLDPLPGIIGNVTGSGATEFTNDQVGKKLDEIGGKK